MGGRVYDFQPKGKVEDFNRWFNECAPKMPHCGSCNKLIFPGEPVGLGFDPERDENVFLHMNTSCCRSGGFYAGHISPEGALIPAFPEGKTAAQHALKTGHVVVVPEIKNLYK